MKSILSAGFWLVVTVIGGVFAWTSLFSEESAGWYSGRVPLNGTTVAQWHQATERDRIDTSKAWIAAWMGRENYDRLGPQAEIMIAFNAKHLADCITNLSKPWTEQPDSENAQAVDLASTCLTMADDIPRADKFN